MIFTSITAYRISGVIPTAQEIIDTMPASCLFTSCSGTAEKSFGFIPPRDKEGPIVEAVAGQYIMRAALETKSVPASVINEKTQLECDRIEAETGRKVGRKERRSVSDDIKMAMIPGAFAKRKNVSIWIDHTAGLLFIDSTSSGVTDVIATLFINALALSMTMVWTKKNPSSAMTEWLLASDVDQWPQNFSIERACHLASTDENKSTAKFNNHHLLSEEIKTHIKQGMTVESLAMSHDGKVSFTLTPTLQIKKIKILDIKNDSSPSDTGADAFDGNVAITCGLIGVMFKDLLLALEGESV